ncbi:MAG: sulfite exporter TauE/SafE family protein [Desulfobacterium sp.]|nr:sulfite exporter TauE/SafE family protein [Desulfobacterium sp.]
MQYMMLIVIAALAFGLSFLFALGGVGSAVALVPALIVIGVPGGVARPVALLVNVASLGGATIHNLRNDKFRPGSWWPLIVFSLPAAPVGAWVSSRIPQDILLGVFAFFMVFSGLLMILPFRQTRDKERETCPPMAGGMIGTRAMHRIDQGRIHLILALVLMASGVRILWKMMG